MRLEHAAEIQGIETRDIGRQRNVGERQLVPQQPRPAGEGAVHVGEEFVISQDRVFEVWRIDAELHRPAPPLATRS